jgi:hypothetical protein
MQAVSGTSADLAVDNTRADRARAVDGGRADGARAEGARAGRIDRDFIINHQIVERYLAGRLPLKGAQDFERFCREHPQLLDEIGLGERIHAALRLLETGGRAPPWEGPPKRWWDRLLTLPVVAGLAALCVVLAATALIGAGRLAAQQHSAAALRQRLAAQPLDAAESTRAITLIPSRTGPSRQSVVTIGGSNAEMADLKIDLSWAKFASYQVRIDRIGQGRVAVLRGLVRDSNGDLRIALNSSALGPGNYRFTIDGLNWRGQAVAQAWTTLTIVH